MGRIKAFLVGVSEYSGIGAPDLPFCKTDIINVNKALREGLQLDDMDIFQMGMTNNGHVATVDFLHALELFIGNLQKDDIFIFYFSGHGTSSEIHNIVFSDGLLCTQDIINKIGESLAKSKVLLIDCCYSGNFRVEGTKSTNLEESIESFQGSGYAILSGSNAIEPSYGGRNGSIFTNILCDGLTNKFLIKKGELSLYDLQLWVKRLLEIHTLNNPDTPQHAIYRANIGGTIYFKISEYTPYEKGNIYFENEDYIIKSVEPVHHGSKKRYAAKILLKKPFSDAEIADVSTKIKKRLLFCDVYNNKIQEDRYKGFPSDIIWIYFTFYDSDILRGNYYCKTTWVSDNQDKTYWYSLKGSNKRLIKGVHFEFYPQYKIISNFIFDNTKSNDEVLYKVKEIRYQMITYAESIISLFNEYQNETIFEDELFASVTPYSSVLDSLFFESNDLPFSDETLSEWVQANITLFSTIHDFTLFYNEKFRNTRDSANRKLVMQSTVLRYYEDLKVLKELEQKR
ncbi:caspase family protein [Bacillus inaquosorum]|uniref:caspase family protein n=1 Tax=Bacillus inaquosorum TaxID=483913 RepID=UPI00227E9E00|nr:caspase family protein [Bacillus inaquosorum]MCY8281762.1 caspase family protein [Bacillus inaquosorum]MCY9064860.1 caspase family protein [Bacillus inaquosorum]MCY9343773.1 caspase family protein [Bacillus inaquosorum]